MPHVVVRHYQNSGALGDELAKRADQVESVIRGIPGFVAYNLARTETGCFSVSVFTDRAGAEQSVAAARDFVQREVPDLAVAPEVVEGDAVISFSA